MKRGWLFSIFLFTILINFVSAQYAFSLSNLFYTIDSTSLILILLFVAIFAILHQIIFLRLFRGNRTVSAIVSFCASVLMVWGMYRMQWNLGGFFYNMGVSEDMLFMVTVAILFIVLIIAILKGWLKHFLAIFGAILIYMSLWTEIFYEWFTVFVIGAIVLIIGLWLMFRSRRGKPYGGKGYNYPSPKKAWMSGKDKYDKFRKWNDPRERLGRQQARYENRDEKRAAKQIRRDQKTDRMGQTGKRWGEKVGSGIGKVKYGKTLGSVRRKEREKRKKEIKQAIKDARGAIATLKNQIIGTIDPKIQRALSNKIKLLEERISELKRELSLL